MRIAHRVVALVVLALAFLGAQARAQGTIELDGTSLQNGTTAVRIDGRTYYISVSLYESLMPPVVSRPLIASVSVTSDLNIFFPVIGTGFGPRAEGSPVPTSLTIGRGRRVYWRSPLTLSPILFADTAAPSTDGVYPWWPTYIARGGPFIEPASIVPVKVDLRVGRRRFVVSLNASVGAAY